MTRIRPALLAIGLATLGAALPAQAACPGSTLADAHACIAALAKARDAALAQGHKTACNAVRLTIDGVAAPSTTALRYEGATVTCHVQATVPATWRDPGVPAWSSIPGATLSLPQGQAYRPPGINLDSMLPTMPPSTGLDASDLFRGYPAMR